MSEEAVAVVGDYLRRFCAPVADERVRAVRDQALALLPEETLMPTTKSEHWRYTSLRTLLAAGASAGGGEAASSEHPASLTNTAILSGASWQTQDSDFTDGITARKLTAAELPDAFWTDLAGVASSGDPFTCLNLAALDDALVIDVPEGTRAEAPLRLIYGAGGERFAQHALIVLNLGSGAECSLIEEEAKSLSGYLNVRLVIRLAVGATLRHERRQCSGTEDWQLSSLDARIKAGANYKLTQASLGGALKRNDVSIRLVGAGAHAEIQALCLALGKQQTDHHFNILHEAGGATSNTNLRGLAGDTGKVIIDGRILIKEGAGATSAHLQNPNLLLTAGAEINSKPALEIYAQDVQCSHGSTVGQLDEQALFYLRSRGIAEGEARLMLIRGFAAAILDDISDADARARWLSPLVAAVM